MIGFSIPLLVDVTLLALAAFVATCSLKDDWIPFGDLRIRIWNRCPAPNMVVAGFDPNDPEDRERFQPTWRNKVGYLLTCPFCLSLYPAAAFGIAYVFAPTGTMRVAVPFDVWALARIIYSRFGTR